MFEKTSRIVTVTAGLTLAFAQLSMIGCNDPASGKAKATAGEAITTASATALAASARAASAPAATKFSFDQATSKVGWTGSKVTGKHDGGFGAFKGAIEVSGGLIENGKVTIDIDTDSLTSDTEKLTGHLKSPDFFDTKAQPKASFTSTEIKKGGDKGASHTVTGNLTIKGVTKAITFPATISLGAESVTVDAEFAINRRDFGLNYAGMPNNLIRDEVVIKLTVRAKKG